MKRLGNLYAQICDLDNLRIAAAAAQRCKSKQPGVIEWNKDPEGNLVALQQELINKSYRTGAYENFIVQERKKRLISKLPFKDRVVHHVIMLILEQMFVSHFTGDTYSCIKGKGIHAALFAVQRALIHVKETQYFLQMDVKQFYPSVKHDVLKRLIRRKIKDADFLELLDEIIDSATGLPIGNYLSQYFANYYLSGFDHWIKETKRVRFYFRYADDLIILARTKDELHQLGSEIREYVETQLQLTIKGNYKVRPVYCHGIDFVGYVIRHTHTLMRKTNKQSFARAVARNKPRASIASYLGWAKHCNSKHLIKKLLPTHEHI